MTFTPQQIAYFRRYEAVRQAGKYNMFSPQAMQLVGGTRQDYMFVLSNYAALKVASEADHDHA